MGNVVAAYTYVKPEGYFSCPRTELLPLVPSTASRVLDIGCGEGEFARSLRAARQSSRLEIVGIELCEGPAQLAAGVLDKVIVGNVEQLDLPYEEYFDCVILADVLEHLIDPWRMVSRVKRFLRRNGHVVASIPNVQHWVVLAGLMIGNWEYCDFGVMDRTHLRFFTGKSINSLFKSNGFELRYMKPRIESGRARIAHLATAGLADPFLARQYFLVASRKDE
jgi:2-polyprenyl-3-methyl-5-hydroxy-6-metoxy-1,4-benzoquinol methylase